jgi:hypothetical protein
VVDELLASGLPDFIAAAIAADLEKGAVDLPREGDEH